MDNEKIKDYINQSRQAGQTDDVIRANLRSAGWQESQIEAGFTSSLTSYNAPMSDFPLADTADQNTQTGQTGRFSFLKNKRLIIIASGSIFVLLLILAIGWYLIFYPKWVKSKVIKGIEKIQVGKIDGEIRTSDGKTQTGKFTVDGYFDGKDSKNLKADLNIGTDFAVGEGINLQAEANFRLIGEKGYVKLNTVPGAGLIDLSSLKDKWIYIDLKDMGSLAGQDLTTTSDLSGKNFDKALAKVNIFKTFKKTKGEKVDGVACHKFNFVIDKEKLPDFMAEMSKLQKPDMTAKEIEDLKKDVKESYKDTESISGSIFSTKGSYLLKRIDLGIRSKESDTAMSFKFSDIGKEKQVEEPKDFQTFEQVFGEMFGSLSMNAGSGAGTGGGSNANNARIKANAARIQTALEDCYNSATGYPFLSDTCITSKFDGGVVPKDGIEYVITGKTYTLTANLEGEPPLELKNKQ